MNLATKFLVSHLLHWVCQFLFFVVVLSKIEQGQKAETPGKDELVAPYEK